MPLKLLLTILFVTISTIVFAQDQSPFQTIGKKGKILTLSSGKYDELFDQKDIQQVGTALINIRTMKVVKLLSNEEEAERLLDNSTSSRFLSADPRMNSFPWWSPYQFAGNTPIQAMDLDGKEIYFYTWDQSKQDQTALQKVGEIDVIEQKSDIAFLTDLFGIRSTQTANLRDLGLEQTWILYDNTWRLVPDNKLNQSLDKISKEEWSTFPTPEQMESTLEGIKGLGDKASLALNVAMAADGLKNIYKGIKSIRDLKKAQSLIEELGENGIKHNPEDILSIGKNATGDIIFLEKGDANAGLEHILKHTEDFVKVGIKEEDIGSVVFDAATNGKKVGMQGTRPIYEVMYNGVKQRIAVTVGSNGFIVGANPAGSAGK
jgi:hypothetical protein